MYLNEINLPANSATYNHENQNNDQSYESYQRYHQQKPDCKYNI